jgi:FAD/FMN-containing dehydrogenase
MTLVDLKQFLRKFRMRPAVDVPSRRRFLALLSKTITFASALTVFGRLVAAKAGAQGAEAKPADPTSDATAAPSFKRGSAAYERARLDAIWNERKPDRYPDQIIFASGDRDIVAAVGLAKGTGRRIGTRSGGHNWIGNHIRDGGILLDLSRMTDISVDADSHIVSIQPGVHARDLQKSLNDVGLRFPTATCPTVGMGGYLLGGGASFTSRLDGPSCFGVVAADVVMADGKLIHATDQTHPEIMWAVRGSGPNFFGVVTKFHLQAKPLHKSMLSSTYIFPVAVAEELFQWHLSISRSLPLAVTHNWFAVKSAMPELGSIPILLNAIAFGDSDEETRALLDVFEKSPLLGKAIVHQPPAPWTNDLGFGLVSRLYPKGFRFRSDALWVDPYKAGFTKLVAEAVSSLPTDRAHILWAPFSTAHQHPNACYSLESPVSIHFYGVSPEATDDKRMDDWVNGWMNKCRPFSYYGGAGKINDNDIIEFPKYFLTPENTASVAKLRKKYDPNGVFFPCIGTDHSVRPA